MLTAAQKTKRQEYRRKWRAENAVKERARVKRQYWANIEKSRAQRRERQRRYRARHPDRVRKINRACYQAKRSERLQKALDYQKANLHTTVKASRNNRRARMRAAPGKITAATVDAIRATQQDQCAYCKCPLHGAGHLEHKTPLSRGGTNYRDNIHLACATCNLRKSSKTHDEFLAEAA